MQSQTNKMALFNSQQHFFFLNSHFCDTEPIILIFDQHKQTIKYKFLWPQPIRFVYTIFRITLTFVKKMQNFAITKRRIVFTQKIIILIVEKSE